MVDYYKFIISLEARSVFLYDNLTRWRTTFVAQWIFFGSVMFLKRYFETHHCVKQ